MKKAWVLAGGGAKGAFQAGAMSALQGLGHYPDAVYGTSVGALNAACYAWHGIDGLFRMWSQITKLSDVFERRWNLFGDSIFSSDPLWRRINTVMCGTRRTAAQPWCCYADLWTGQTHYMTLGHPDFKRMVLASASLPVICPPVDGRYIDGGVVEPCPLRKAIDEGAESIVVILCASTTLYEQRPKSKLEIAVRSLDIICNELVRNDVSVAIRKNGNGTGKRCIDIKIVQPEFSWTMGTLEFNQDSIQQAFIYGSDIVKGVFK